MDEIHSFQLALGLEREAVKQIVLAALYEAYAVGLEGRQLSESWVNGVLSRLEHPSDSVAEED